MNRDIWDVIIVGGGPAGCSAAIVLARSKRKVLVLDDGNQRNIRSSGMHNFLTRDDILPGDFLTEARRELKKYGVHTIRRRAANARKLEDKGFEIVDDTGASYLCRRLLLATGVTDNVPDVPGMKELWGASVFHCPFCDGWECMSCTVGLYANKINGYGMALALRQLSDKVILFTDGAKYLRPKQKLHLDACNIEVVSSKMERLVYEDTTLTDVALKDGTLIPCNAMFVDHGHKVNNELITELECRCTKKGAVIANRQQQTSIEGVYVAGDASYDMHFVVVASAEGVKAAVSIHNDLLNTDNSRF